MSSKGGKKKDKFRKKQDLKKFNVNIKVGGEVRQLLKVATEAPLKSDRARACYDLAYCFTEGKGVGEGHFGGRQVARASHLKPFSFAYSF